MHGPLFALTLACTHPDYNYYYSLPTHNFMQGGGFEHNTVLYKYVAIGIVLHLNQ
jgi:hypothetical protein